MFRKKELGDIVLGKKKLNKVDVVVYFIIDSSKTNTLGDISKSQVNKKY